MRGRTGQCRKFGNEGMRVEINEEMEERKGEGKKKMRKSKKLKG